MFESLTQRLTATVNALRGRARLTEDNIKDALREIRIALLEADVALPVVQELIEQIKVKAVGQEVLQSLSPGQALVKVVYDELTTVMGSQQTELSFNTQPPAVILMAGLQGAGKTTTVAKLARFLMERKKKKVMVASVDVYRPAAIDQLRTLAGQVGCAFYSEAEMKDPIRIAMNALDDARKSHFDALIIDTAGRLAIDQAMMEEIAAIHRAVDPIETLFVVDAMTGQDAANTAKAFAAALPLTGVVLTKVDGDARGGAALSVRRLTDRPIKFVGVGEKSDALESFFPDRIAQRILGMGDVLSLVEDVERKVDAEKAAKLADKVIKGKRFDLNDLRGQLQQMLSMGGMGTLLDKLPGMANIPQQLKSQVNDKEIKRMIAIINSMTKKERRFPDTLNGSRRSRIARGSGTQPQDVNRLLKQYQQTAKMMSKLAGGGLKGIMRQMGGLMKGGKGGFPPF